ncbi:MAG: PFL family protein [Candidatus Bathyarchaeia archaeon]
MFTPEEVFETYEMIFLRHLNVRAVTLGISLLSCIDRDFEAMLGKIRKKIVETAGGLAPEAEFLERKHGIPIVNKRLSVTPAALLLEPTVDGLGSAEAMKRATMLAETFDDAAESVDIDFIGGFGALVQKGWTKGDSILIDSIPVSLSQTERVCSCVNIATTKAGINVDAAWKMGQVIKETSELTADRNGIGCAKLVTFANAPEDNPFMAGAYHGVGETETTINVGISGPGVVRAVVEEAEGLDFRGLTDMIKRASFKVARVGELIGREMASRLGAKFGSVDLSLAPTPQEGDSIADIIEAMGVEYCGAPGSTAALALLTDAVKKGGVMAASSVGGLSGAFIPVSEDSGMRDAVSAKALTIEKLEAMTSVCSVGLDMIAIPGDTLPETISAIILDEVAIGVVNNKPAGVRLIPVPGSRVGDTVRFGGLFGETKVMAVSTFSPARFVRRGGQIPAPILSLTG